MPGPQQEVITIAWLAERGAQERDEWFYLHGFSQGQQVSLCFRRDWLGRENIDHWALMGMREDDRIFLPTIHVGPLNHQRVSLARFYTVVMSLGINLN